MMAESDTGCLAGLRVLDLSRILSGPTCTQKPGEGDVAEPARDPVCPDNPKRNRK
jgi:hypothetical protein